MKNVGVYGFRRRNLERLIATVGEGEKKAFAEKTGLSPAHVSQMVNGVRQVGDKVARRIEHALGLPDGVMDVLDAAELDDPITVIAGRTAYARARRDLAIGGEPEAGKPAIKFSLRRDEAATDPTDHVDIDSLIAKASPRSQALLKRIANAAEQGRLSEDDLALLEQISSRLEKQ